MPATVNTALSAVAAAETAPAPGGLSDSLVCFILEGARDHVSKLPEASTTIAQVREWVAETKRLMVRSAVVAFKFRLMLSLGSYRDLGD